MFPNVGAMHRISCPSCSYVLPIPGTNLCSLCCGNRPLSRRLDRCDRVIQKESGDPNAAICVRFSRVRHNAHYVPYAQIRFDHSYYKNSYVTWTPGILSRHLANGCVLKCNCIGLMVFRNLSCLGIIIMLYK